MPTLFDPLAYLATLGAYAKVSINTDGDRYITLEFKRGISSSWPLVACGLMVVSLRKWNRKRTPRTGRGGVLMGVEKGVEKWLAPSNLVRTTRNMLEYMMRVIDSKSAEGNLLRVQVSLPVPS